MKKQQVRETKRRKTEESSSPMARPVPAREQTKRTAQLPPRNCYHCMFCVTNLVLWARTLLSGFPVIGQCVNHVDTPGQWRPVPSRPCRNFRARPYRTEPPEPPDDSIRYIPLTRGLHAIVDAEDYEWLSRYKWHVTPSPRSGTFYARRSRGKGGVLMHREIMNPPEGMVVDHINGNGLDNRRCNLRICTQAENSRNSCKHSDGKSRFIGVYPHRDKWEVIVTHERKDHYGGSFTDEVEAARARDRLALQLHGQFARLNFPELREELERQEEQKD